MLDRRVISVQRFSGKLFLVSENMIETGDQLENISKIHGEVFMHLLLFLQRQEYSKWLNNHYSMNGNLHYRRRQKFRIFIITGETVNTNLWTLVTLQWNTFGHKFVWTTLTSLLHLTSLTRSISFVPILSATCIIINEI